MTALKTLITCSVLLCTPCVWAQESIHLKIGDVKTIKSNNIARVAVGDGKIINAVTDDVSEVIIFAREKGQTSLFIWDQSGNKTNYQIIVKNGAELSLKSNIYSLLKKIPNAKVSTVGNKVIIEGDGLTDADRQRVAILAKHYPQIVDLTSSIGWEKMVLLDVQVLEIPRSFLQELGVAWDSSSIGGLQAGYATQAGSLTLPTESTAFGAVTRGAGVFSLNAMLSAKVRALAQTGQAVVLAQPQLIARSGTTAEFLAGGEVPYSTTDTNGNSQTVFKEYGVRLNITPQIERNNNVRSKINVEVSSVDQSISLPGGPALKTRRASTEFNVKSGQTLVLAGFISRDQFNNIDKLPGMGDIPIIDNLFKSKRFQRNETELAIFVRPVVMDADNEQQQQRIQRSNAIISSSFENPNTINVPIQNQKHSSTLDMPINAHHLNFNLLKPLRPSQPLMVIPNARVTFNGDKND